MNELGADFTDIQATPSGLHERYVFGVLLEAGRGPVIHGGPDVADQGVRHGKIVLPDSLEGQRKIAPSHVGQREVPLTFHR